MESRKWVGTTAAYFLTATAEDIWAVAGDFCAAHRWMKLDTCCQVEGVKNQPACVRLCSSGDRWAKERLVAFDPVGRSYSYEMVDNNMSFGEYFATIKVDQAGKEGCRVEWSFESDPVEGKTYDGLLRHMQAALESLGNAVVRR